MAAAACRLLDVPCLVADLRRLPAGADADPAVRGLLLESGLAGAVLVLCGAERAGRLEEQPREDYQQQRKGDRHAPRRKPQRGASNGRCSRNRNGIRGSAHVASQKWVIE